MHTITTIEMHTNGKQQKKKCYLTKTNGKTNKILKYLTTWKYVKI